MRTPPVVVRFSLALLLLSIVPPLMAGGEFEPATPEELALKSMAMAPGAPAVILQWNDSINDKESYRSQYFRIKIMTDEGKKYGDVEIPYTRSVSSVRAIKARTIRPDGTIVPFTGRIYDKLIVKNRDVRVMAKTFSLSEVQVGCIIEYRYDILWDSMWLLPTHWILQSDLPVLHASLRLTPYTREYSSYYLYVGEPGSKQPVKTRYEWQLDLENLAPFESEPYSPPEDQLKPRVEFFYTKMRTIDADTYWKNEGKEWADAIEGFIGKRTGIEKTVAGLAHPAGTADATLRKIYARVQQVRNLSYAADKTEQEEKREKIRANRHIEDVLRNGYAYRNEINRLFVGMARAAGFESNVVRVSQRDDVVFRKELPDGRQLNDEVLTVTLDGKELYLDPGTPTAPFGLLSWENAGVAGFRISKKDGGTWVSVPRAEASMALTQRKATLHLEEGVIKGTASVGFRGQEALVRRLASLNDDETSQKKRMEDEVMAWFPDGSKITMTKVTGLKGVEEPLVGDFDVELPTIVSVVGSRAILPLSVFESNAKNPFVAERRVHPVAFDFPHVTEDEVTLAIPEGFAPESIPAGVKIDQRAVAYENHWLQSGNAITLNRRLTLMGIDFGTESYRSLRSFFSRVLAADQENLVLKEAAIEAAGGTAR